jgi:hypothetical protein
VHKSGIRTLAAFKILSYTAVIKNKYIHQNYLHPETMMHLFIRQWRNEKLLKGKNESLFLATAEEKSLTLRVSCVTSDLCILLSFYYTM